MSDSEEFHGDSLNELFKASVQPNGVFGPVTDKWGTVWHGQIINYGGGGWLAFGKDDKDCLHLFTMGDFPRGRPPGLTGVEVTITSEKVSRDMIEWLSDFFNAPKKFDA